MTWPIGPMGPSTRPTSGPERSSLRWLHRSARPRRPTRQRSQLSPRQRLPRPTWRPRRPTSRDSSHRRRIRGIRGRPSTSRPTRWAASRIRPSPLDGPRSPSRPQSPPSRRPDRRGHRLHRPRHGRPRRHGRPAPYRRRPHPRHCRNSVAPMLPCPASTAPALLPVSLAAPPGRRSNASTARSHCSRC